MTDPSIEPADLAKVNNAVERDIDDDITEDLTIDGADLLAELQAAHNRQAGGDPDELTIDGAELLEELKATPQAVPVVPHFSGVGRESNDTTLARWSPPPSLPTTADVVETRAGRPNRVQLLVIAAVMVAALALGGWVLRDVLPSAETTDTQQDGEDPASSDGPDGPYVRGFGK